MVTFHPNQRVSKALERFRRRHTENYEIVETFAIDLLAQGISEFRVRSYVNCLMKILDIVEKKLEEFTREDIRKVLAHYQMLINKGHLSESSVYEVKKTFKKFFKWMGKEELVDWFTLGNVKSNISPHDLISPEEFEALIKACFNSRDRAFLALIYETGARIGEIGAMRVKDVVFDDYGAIVWLPRSKTMKRRLRVVYASKYIAEWLSDHPLKEDPNAPLWIKLSGKNYMKSMVYEDFYKQLKKITKRAGIKKKIYPHLFRHTRATRLLQRLPEAVGAKYMGWVPGTRMTKVYIHLADQDVEKAILNLYGIKTEDGDKDLDVIQCPRCDYVNPVEGKYCSRCGLPLTEEAVREVEEWEREKSKLLEALTKPEVLQLILSMKDEIERLKKLVEEKKEGE